MWVRESITEGELDALREAAERAWGGDTRYPNWRGSHRYGGGQCFVTSRWLAERLGGYVGVCGGHYAWVSPGGAFVIDLTSNHHGGAKYGLNDGYELVEWVPNERADRFARRANRIFDSLDRLLKLGDDYMGDAFPGEEPQREEDTQQQYWHDEPTYESSDQQYQFVYANGQLEISPEHDHLELSTHAGIGADHRGPVAVGYVTVRNNQATWDVQSNVNAASLARVFKDASKQYGWKWGGLCNLEGEPISDEFAPKGASVLAWAYDDGHVFFGRTSHADLLLAMAQAGGSARYGWARVGAGRAEIYPVVVDALPALFEWATDAGLTLYAMNDNVMKRIEDLQTENTGANSEDLQTDDQFGDHVDVRDPAGVYRCPSCQQLFPTWREYQLHRRDEEPYDDEPVEDGKFPEVGSDNPQPAHWTDMQPSIMPLASYKEAARVDGFEGDATSQYYVAYQAGQPTGYAWLREGKLHQLKAHSSTARWAILAKLVRYTGQDPKDLLEAEIPFIYDINEDKIATGHPGTRTSDIPGRFTPGGILEGTYEPGGKVVIRSMTSVPVSIHYLVRLWYAQHPELQVTGVSLMDDAGKETKLAAERDTGRYLAGLVAADPVADAASKALYQAGGRVFVVGGAVRDALMGKDPKDLDLMVSGLPSERVQEVLQGLPGRVDYTGKDFGVFRYRRKGADVEIALPRRERSTGVGHQDFDVQADHTMTPEEDLYRRDFTANALAVDLGTGKLIDPYHGADDIANGRLRTIHENSLAEDPLRVVRALVANARHDLQPDDVTKAQMAANVGSLQHLPQERIKAELDKLFGADKPAQAIRLAHDTGILGQVLPEVEQAFGYNQDNPHHELELGKHLVNVLDRTSQKTKDPDLRLAALLHDIGKPASRWDECPACSANMDQGRRRVVERGLGQCPDCGGPVSGHYYGYRDQNGMHGANHEDVGSEMARARLNALRYPADRIGRVSELVQHHMFPAFTSPKGARRFLNRVGDHADDLLTLRWADQGGKSEYPTDPTLSVDEQRNLLEQVRNAGEATNRSQLAIDGRDLIQLGVPAGPQVGQILQQLVDATIEDPGLNQRNTLLEMAREYATL